MEIQETVERYAEIISKIAFVDVEVVDRRLFRVAGTGMFKAHVNEDMSSAGYTYSRVLDTGERQIIYEPGKDPVCDQCPQKGVCGEEIEIFIKGGALAADALCGNCGYTAPAGAPAPA